jgi:hypothetical protein
MKFISNKNWATVLCAAAVFSMITLRDAQAAGTRTIDILPPPPVDSTSTDGVVSSSILPPPPIDNDLGGGETLNGDFSGTVMLD